MSFARVLAVAACLAAAFPALAQDTVRPVKLMTVTAGDNGLARQFFGQVVARQTVDLAFQVAGQVAEFPAIEGETIPAGDLVAELDLEPFELALDEARVRKDQADRTVERFGRLSGDSVSQVTVDDARTQADLAAIAVRNAEYALENGTLHAPFDALVASRLVANFTTIAAGTPVARLHDMSELRIEIDVPEVLFQRAGKDPDLEILAQFPASDERFPLEPREFNAEASAVGQTFRLTLGLAPPEGINILPGSSVTVVARLRGDGGQVVIPASAVIAGNDGSLGVMVFEPTGADTGTVSRVAIEVEPTPDGEVSVLDGLSAGQEIVVAGGAMLADGQAVRRFAGFPE